jgi:pimeloyl-ACP methyl ester carboxylesterase
LALAYALEHPEKVRGIVYLSGVGSDPSWSDRSAARHRALRSDAEWRRGEANWVEYERAESERRAALYREHAEIDWPTDFSDRSFGATQVGPMLADGQFLHLEVLRASPHGEFVGLEHVGHFAVLEAPDRLRELLRRFLRERAAPSPA